MSYFAASITIEFRDIISPWPLSIMFYVSAITDYLYFMWQPVLKICVCVSLS